MKIDYSSILTCERVQADNAVDGTLLAESESDRGRVLFSPAFRKLEQHAGAEGKSTLSHALQMSQIGNSIARQIAASIEAEGLVTSTECAALVNFVEAACLIRHIGTPPFGRSGNAAIQKWFIDHGPNTIRTACKTFGGREIGESDPRLVNALADFYEFDGNPQGLRIIAKLQWNADPRSLNLTKTSIASYLMYLRMAGGKADKPAEKFTEQAGFFSTEAGLVKNIWSGFTDHAAAPQRFPLTYIVEAADKITALIGDLEETLETNSLRQREVINDIKDHWLNAYIPIAPDPADGGIFAALSTAAESKDAIRDKFNYTDLRTRLIAALTDYAARCYLEQHQAVFDGTLNTLLPVVSSVGTLLAIVKNYRKRQTQKTQSAQHQELAGYAVIYGLLEHFSILLECSHQRFQAALDPTADQDEFGTPVFIEMKLLSLFPKEYIDAYMHLIAQIGNGRDAEFEEWNARAHLIVDFLAGMSDSSAAAAFKVLSGTRC